MKSHGLFREISVINYNGNILSIEIKCHARKIWILLVNEELSCIIWFGVEEENRSSNTGRHGVFVTTYDLLEIQISGFC